MRIFNYTNYQLTDITLNISSKINWGVVNAFMIIKKD
jgi:hypothetical protein